MYQFVVTRAFLQKQKNYTLKLDSKWAGQFEKLKNIFKVDIFDVKLKTHKIYEFNSIKVYSSYINWRDRLIFFYKNPKKVYLYKIMIDHDYRKLLSNIDVSMRKFLEEI